MQEFNKRELLQTLEPVIENTAMRYNLVPLETAFEKENNKWFLRIFIWASDHNVSHLDCENISRSLGDMLDELIPFKYYLEVSSPGLDRRFKSEKEYIIFRGHDVIIKLKNSIPESDSKKLEAKLLDYNESFGIKVELNGKEVIIPMDKIHSTKLNDKIEINKNKEKNND